MSAICGNNINKRLTAWAALRIALAALVWPASFSAAARAFGDDTNSFPDLSDVFQGRIFTNSVARDVFFLQQIRQRYPAHWPSLLAMNLTVGDYVVSPEKMLQFVEEVAAAGENTDDPIACACLAAVITNAEFYTNITHPEIQEAVVVSLIKIGPKGRLALADAFSESHYRTDPESLETLADTIGKSGVADSNITAALAATAFTLTATNGGFYPRCTREAVKNLLCLTNGVALLRSHLNTNEVFKDPGRFQAVMDGIADSRADSLITNLNALADAIKTRFTRLAPGPDPYRDDLSELQTRLQQTVQRLRPVPK
jgi:hypothetical protein